MLDANRLVLLDLRPYVEGVISDACVVQGEVTVERGAMVNGSTLRGPLIIGAGAEIENSYIGPFTAVGAGCTIRGCEVEHTIIMERSHIVDVPHRIADSLIGRNVTITRSLDRPKAYRLMLGDHSKVGVL